MLVTSRGVTLSNGTGNVAGVFVLGRYFDNEMIRQISDQVQLPVSVQPLGGKLPPDFEHAELTLPKNSRKSLRVPLSEKTNAVYLRLYDLYNQPVMLARLEAPRYAYQQGLTSLRALLLAMLIIGEIFGTLLFITQNFLEYSRRERQKSDALYSSLTLNSRDILFSIDFLPEDIRWFGDTDAFFGTVSPCENNLAA